MQPDAAPGHTRLLDNRRISPVVVSQNRFEGIMSRSRMDKKHAAAAQTQEELRYLQYLKDGSDWLCSRFTNMGHKTRDEQIKEKLAHELVEAEVRLKRTKMEDDLLRKKRILRAQRILMDLKPGQQALRHALLESETIYQRKYNEAINRDIQEDAKRQHKIQDEMCPQILLPLGSFTEEELKAKEEAKKVMLRADTIRIINERREKKLAEEEQEICDVITDRAQYQCLYEQEQREAKRRKQMKTDFYRRSYQDGLKDKAARKKYEQIRNDIEDRIICVDVTKNRILGRRCNDQFKAVIAENIKNRENRAIEVSRQHQAKKREAEDNQKETVARYVKESEMKEAGRQAERDRLAKERRAYEQEDRKRAVERRQSEAEIQRFRVAERLKNMEANKRFYTLEKQREDQKKASLKDNLCSQREEFNKRRDEEKMRLCACEADRYIKEDVIFFEDAEEAIANAQMTGRPIYPMAKVVEDYRRKYDIGMHAKEGMVGRRKTRDFCWPGYHSKAELAYSNYAARRECHQAEEEERAKILKSYVKITKMAADERPQKIYAMQCPYACYQHRDMPGIGNVAKQGAAKIEPKALPKNTPLQKFRSAVMGTIELKAKGEPKCSQTNLAKAASASKSVGR